MQKNQWLANSSLLPFVMEEVVQEEQSPVACQLSLRTPAASSCQGDSQLSRTASAAAPHFEMWGMNGTVIKGHTMGMKKVRLMVNGEALGRGWRGSTLYDPPPCRSARFDKLYGLISTFIHPTSANIPTTWVIKKGYNKTDTCVIYIKKLQQCNFKWYILMLKVFLLLLTKIKPFI